ncbi:hypothetical protein JS562_55700, partial [Agrobacterium sp. S2]|nr:hypothetical protein [Agrobacterium sp. S2]
MSGRKCRDLRRAGLDRLDAGLRLDLVDDLDRHVVAAPVQDVQDAVDEPEGGHRGVGDDGDALDVGHVGQVADGVRLEVRLGRDLEPLQVVVPPAHALDVDEVDRRHVVRHRVVAVGAAAEGERRDEGVVDVADAAERRGGVRDDADRLDAVAYSSVTRSSWCGLGGGSTA